MTDVQITQLAKDELAARGLVINYEENNYAAGLYDGIIKGAQLERDNDITVRSDNTKVIENLQEENEALKAELAPFRRMKEEYEKYCKDNEGNGTIVRDENGHISVIFGDGKVLLSMVSAELNKDNTPVHGIVLTALKEKHEMGVDLYNGKSVPELAKEGVVYHPSVVILFKNAKGVHGLEEFTKEVKRRFAADNEEKGVV